MEFILMQLFYLFRSTFDEFLLIMLCVPLLGGVINNHKKLLLGSFVYAIFYVLMINFMSDQLLIAVLNLLAFAILVRIVLKLGIVDSIILTLLSLLVAGILQTIGVFIISLFMQFDITKASVQLIFSPMVFTTYILTYLVVKKYNLKFISILSKS